MNYNSSRVYNRSSLISRAVLFLCDASPASSQMFTDYLEKMAFNAIKSFESGKAFLEVARGETPDLILLNTNVSDMPALEIISELKSDMQLRDIPIIVVSTRENPSEMAKFLAAGAEDFAAKPINAVLLESRICASLERYYLRQMEKKYISDIQKDKNFSDQLISAILPPSTIAELKTSGSVSLRTHENVVVLFCDIVGFTTYCSKNSAVDVVDNLQRLFLTFEQLTDQYEMEKIKTIGDAFMAIAGLLRPNSSPLDSAVRCGLEMIEATKQLDIGCNVRIGINIGPLVSGVVGKHSYQFDVWGDTVNTASRMADIADASSLAMNINCWMKLQDSFLGKTLGLREVKGKGLLEIILVSGLK